MTVQAVLLPVFVLVGITFWLLFWTGYARVGAIKRGEARMKEVALGQPNWPPRVTQIANAYHNQLQLPLLFYVLVALALFTRKADLLFVVMSWLFVLARIVHVAIHVTSNYVPNRFYAFAAGAVILLLMWIIFAVRLLLAI
jgi:hypothetical protein